MNEPITVFQQMLTECADLEKDVREFVKTKKLTAKTADFALQETIKAMINMQAGALLQRAAQQQQQEDSARIVVPQPSLLVKPS